MSFASGIDVDAVVKAVLAELNRRAHVDPTPEPDVFAGRLLSLRHVETLDSESKEIRLLSGTVVTPLAIDGLKRRGIALKYVLKSDGPARHATDAGEWAFGIEGKPTGRTAALRRSLLAGFAEVSSSELPPWVVARPDRGGILLTQEASVASWRASRVAGIRAATVAEPEAAARAVRHLGVNYLVVEPASLSIPFVKSIADAFRKGGAPTLPEGLR